MNRIHVRCHGYYRIHSKTEKVFFVCLARKPAQPHCMRIIRRPAIADQGGCRIDAISVRRKLNGPVRGRGSHDPARGWVASGPNHAFLSVGSASFSRCAFSFRDSSGSRNGNDGRSKSERKCRCCRCQSKSTSPWRSETTPPK